MKLQFTLLAYTFNHEALQAINIPSIDIHLQVNGPRAIVEVRVWHGSEVDVPRRRVKLPQVIKTLANLRRVEHFTGPYRKSGAQLRVGKRTIVPELQRRQPVLSTDINMNRR